VVLEGGGDPLAVREALSASLFGQEGEVFAGVAWVNADEFRQFIGAERSVLGKDLGGTIPCSAPAGVGSALSLLIPLEQVCRRDHPTTALEGGR
jgi:hypothetical protein